MPEIAQRSNNQSENRTWCVSRGLVGLHQCSALRHFLFVVVLDVLSESVRKEALWERMYADDLGYSHRDSIVIQGLMAETARLARELYGEYIPMTSCATNALRLRHQAFSNAWKQWPKLLVNVFFSN